MFCLQQNRRKGQNRFCLEVAVGGVDKRRGDVAQTMYTHVSKCRNYKIKDRKWEKKLNIQKFRKEWSLPGLGILGKKDGSGKFEQRILSFSQNGLGISGVLWHSRVNIDNRN
jgi:hypothetical protein